MKAGKGLGGTLIPNFAALVIYADGPSGRQSAGVVRYTPGGQTTAPEAGSSGGGLSWAETFLRGNRETINMDINSSLKVRSIAATHIIRIDFGQSPLTESDYSTITAYGFVKRFLA